MVKKQKRAKKQTARYENLYKISVEELCRISEEKDMQALQKLGGSGALTDLLHSDGKAGLTPDGASSDLSSVAAHTAAFGTNVMPTAPAKNLLLLWFDAFKDPIILLLCAAATLSTVLGAVFEESRAEGEWAEGVAIWIAVLLVTAVGAGNDFQKDRQFRKLNAQKNLLDIKTRRGNQDVLVKNTDIVVGDVVSLETGDKIIADGLVLESFGLVVDEASLTGESDPIKKNAQEDPWLRSGTAVSEGSGRMLVLAVGINSDWGKTMALLQEAGDEMTPLQHKLASVAAFVGKIGASVAAIVFVALLIKWCIENQGFPLSEINNNGPVQFFLYAVTIIVVAIPEGLPLAVTMALAYSMTKMMKDNNFVRVLSACETMGGATAICSDKTGTLTENRMTVTEGWFAGTKYQPVASREQMEDALREQLELNICLNSTAVILEHDKELEFVGNRTDCALLVLVRNWGLDYNVIREKYHSKVVQLYGFSSAKKMASVLLQHDASTLRLYNKGAAEWVLKRCDRVAGPGGLVSELTETERERLIHDVVEEMADRGLRCICLSYRDFPAEDPTRPADFFDHSDDVDNGLVALAIVGIKDPVRQEVPGAVRACQGAGIRVRMVTGDNIHTACHIARECGILTEDTIAMEGPVFRALSEEEAQEKVVKLSVLARSSPEDKLKLVRLLKTMGEVVSVTGDGTNDAPALKESDVGLAMGIAGTEVAKSAADIIILDDNFLSIVKSVMWGRNVFVSIRKFLQFQLTVNLVALVVAGLGALVGGHEPLNVMQLLWVNLIMDTLGALALATEMPSPQLLLDKPNGRTEQLITRRMYFHICAMGCYQIFFMFLMLYGFPVWLPQYYIQNSCEYYADTCTSTAQGLGFDATAVQQSCNYVNECGFPCGSSSSTTCSLYPVWNGTVPGNAQEAMCNSTTTSCTAYTNWDQLQSQLSHNYEDYDLDAFMPLAALLFNSFIFSQIVNLVHSRRIQDEYDILGGILRGPIFLCVLTVIIACQLIIMFFLNDFFKIGKLDAQGWGISLAWGFGTFFVGYINKFTSRKIFGPPPRKNDAVERAMSGTNSPSPAKVAAEDELAPHVAVPRHAQVVQMK